MYHHPPACPGDDFLYAALWQRPWHSIHTDLDIVNVTKRFGAHAAVDDVTFSVAPGEFFSILGPSGCGKTTLMRMIAGFEHPTSGDIRIRGTVDDRRSGQPPPGQHGVPEPRALSR